MRKDEIAGYLDRYLVEYFARHQVPPLQMEFDFGEAFNSWSYDEEGRLQVETDADPWHDDDKARRSGDGNRSDFEDPWADDFEDDIPF